MRNYRDELIEVLNQISNLDTNEGIYAKELIGTILIKRYENEIKEIPYLSKLRDEFTALKILNIIDIYIEEFYLLEKDNNENNLRIQESLRNILRLLKYKVYNIK